MLLFEKYRKRMAICLFQTHFTAFFGHHEIFMNKWNAYTIDIFKDPGFSQFRMVLDAEMKRLQSAGIGAVH